jgi:hypothetical protein
LVSVTAPNKKGGRLEQTKTDFAAILGSAVAFLLAVCGVIFEPVTVDSTRPTHSNAPASIGSGSTADARLWDDPFVVFPDTSEYKYEALNLPDDTQVLVLLVPASTRLYEEDRESRLRLRFAIQHALLDQGYEPIQGGLLFALEAPFSNDEDNGPTKTDGHSLNKAPIQFFRLRQTAKQSSTKTSCDRYSLVTVIWLPDEAFSGCPRQNVMNVIVGNLDKQLTTCQVPAGNRQYALLGPWDSDELPYFENLPVPASYAGKPPWIVSYRATVADQRLPHLLAGRDFSSPANPSLPIEERAYLESKDGNTRIIRTLRPWILDDDLCKALVQEIRRRGTLSLHSRAINVWVFSEWDTLYGRALVQSFRASANGPGNSTSAIEKRDSEPRETSPTPRPSSADDPGYPNPPISITVVPYLRGLDGASTLYSDRYLRPSANDKEESTKQKERELEYPEGTTQFDYIRRLTSSLLEPRAPFLKALTQPDAIVIFGSDVYDKLVLLKFLKQELETCTYLTTDLDALYWHPHYLEYTHDLVVASAFPLAMRPSSCGLGESVDSSTDTAVELRDSYQSATYLAVSRLTYSANKPIDEALLRLNELPITCRIGNTEPLPLVNPSPTASSSTPAKLVDYWGALILWLNFSLQEIREGVSPFLSMMVQLLVVGLGITALCFDIPSRTRFPQRAADELWNWALSFIPEGAHAGLLALRRCLRRKWLLVPAIRWLTAKEQLRFHAASSAESPVQVAGCPGNLGDDNLEDRAAEILKHYRTQLQEARTKRQLGEVALYLLSDLFNLRTFRAGKPMATVTDTTLPPDIKPFAQYLFGEFRWLSSSRYLGSSPGLFGSLTHFVRTNLPSLGFFVASSVGVILLVIVCIQPVPFMVGSETRTYWVRVLRWIVESSALLVTFFVFYRVCFEQRRFRRLIQALANLVPKTSGLSNRQLLILIARSGEQVGNLSTIPCALVFLLFIAHLRPLGGVALGIEELCLLLWGPVMLFYSFLKLRSTATGARADVRKAYQREKMIAMRLMVRLRSFATDAGPIQDDLESLKSDIQRFVSRNSTLPQGRWVEDVYKELHTENVRNRLYVYLETWTDRNQQILEEVDDCQQGVLAPLLGSPILSALLIPVGGAGGISLVAWLVSFLR